ncbi:MAG: FlgD immunoglobulin-like domain containing protein, partial [Candidatus Cloacimonadota bacterium]|nr:FlgD immunoglobulin-like domain containing protein [Candidatus Cloacimonadota bacterium]
YLTGLKDGVHRFEVTGEEIIYLDTYLEMPDFYKTLINDNTAISLSIDYGAYFFDLSNPDNPVFIQYLLYDAGYNYYIQNNKLAVSFYSEGHFYFDLFDISDPYNIELIFQTPLENFEILISANESWSEIFTMNIYTNNSYLKKYSLSENGEIQEIYIHNTQSTRFYILIDDYGYYITNNGSGVDLNVLYNINSEMPELISAIDIGNFSYNSLGFTLNNSLLEFSDSSAETTFFYNYENLAVPQFVTELSEYSPNKGLNYENYYLSANGGFSYIYNLDNPDSTVYPIDEVLSQSHNISGIESFNNEEGGFLLVTNQGSLEIWSTEITQNLNDNISPISKNLSNYPNPFNPTTTIRYNLPKESFVNLSIFNIKGQKVNTLINENMLHGNHQIEWNGKNENGNNVSSGVYFYKLDVNGNTKEMKKMLLLK